MLLARPAPLQLEVDGKKILLEAGIEFDSGAKGFCLMLEARILFLSLDEPRLVSPKPYSLTKGLLAYICSCSPAHPHRARRRGTVPPRGLPHSTPLLVS